MWSWHTFSNLTPHDLYQLLELRQQVFILEQRCLYPDIDQMDYDAMHLLGKMDNKIIACLRLLPENIPYTGHISFGRVVTAKKYRGRKIGKSMIDEVMRYLQHTDKKLPLAISAQSYLEKFYGSYGFQRTGTPYDEDGIPHIKMTRPSP